jgi:hypothetical protein
MKNYNIITGELFTGLDTSYDAEANKIDVYSSVSWSADTEEKYKEKEAIINNWSYEDDLCKANAWCDISGFNYWVIQQEEDNYVSIDVCLKKAPELYTQEEMQKLRDIIIEADNYFEENL